MPLDDEFQSAPEPSQRARALLSAPEAVTWIGIGGVAALIIWLVYSSF